MSPYGRLSAILLLTVAVSAIAYLNQTMLGITGVVMLYLLVVLAGAYYLRVSLAFSLALLATLLINFLVVEPRYTFRIASIESWIALGGFLMVSLVVTSLVRRLQERTAEAEATRSQAQFARVLAERLAQESQPSAVLSAAADSLQEHLRVPVCICWQEDGALRCIPSATPCKPEPAAVNWVMQNAKMLGPGSSNWPQSPYVMLPFSRLPGHDPVLVCALVGAETPELQMELRSLCDQVALAYQRAASGQRAQQAELNGRTEAMQNALLASLSHDMRTPLTTILGAASTLVTQQAALDATSRTQLLHSILSEADYLCRATENILSLARLNALGSHGLTLDWQSLEEVVGSTLTRYRARDLSWDIKAEISSAALIRADATLLSQALANLLDNALAVHQGPEPLLVSVRQEAGALVIAVADRGPGFPAGFTADHLQKFHHRHHRGFGLGLVIVATIASLHGARLDFMSRAGGGAEVSLRFPLTDAAVMEKGAAGDD